MLSLLFRKKEAEGQKINSNGIIRMPLDGKVPPNPEIQQLVADALKHSDETMKRLGYKN